MTNLWQLTWADVDPAARPAFDRSGITMLVRTLPPVAGIPPAGSDWRLVDVWYDRMTAALVDRLGDWVVGWQYTVAMEDVPDRGVVPVWRADRPAITTPARTLARLADAVLAWHDLLVELATDARGRFAAAAPPPAPPPAVGDGDPPAWRAVHSRHRVTVHPGPHPRRLPHPSGLSWADVAPGRDFDRATVPATVSDLAAADPMPAPGADRRLIDLWLENITVGLVDRYGRRAVGWRWSIGEGELGGGPVGSWCCFPHSVTTPAATAARISAALVEWHDWVDELAERFARVLPLAADDLDGWERAIADLITTVGDRAQYESGRDSCCRTVLGWFLEAAGSDPTRREDLLDRAVTDRFDGWLLLPEAVVAAVAEDLALRVAFDHAGLVQPPPE